MGGVHSPVTLNVINWFFTGISTVLVALRLVSRFFKGRNSGVDDWAIIIAFLFNIGYAISLSIAIHHGLGQHLMDIPPPNISEAVLSTFVASSFSIWSFAFPKMAVSLLIVRLLSVKKWVQWLLPSLAGLCVAMGISGSILFWNLCDPPAAAWDPMGHPGFTCLNPNILADYAYAYAAYSGFLDILFALIPGYLFWQLQMDTRKKLVVSCVMGLGIFAGVIALYKCSTISGLKDPSDITYSAVPLLLWTSLEANLVIIAACVPTIGPVFRSARTAVTSQFSGYGRSKGSKQDDSTGFSADESKTSKLLASQHRYDVRDLEGGEPTAKFSLMPDGHSSDSPSTNGSQIGVSRSVNVTMHQR